MDTYKPRHSSSVETIHDYSALFASMREAVVVVRGKQDHTDTLVEISEQAQSVVDGPIKVICDDHIQVSLEEPEIDFNRYTKRPSVDGLFLGFMTQEMMQATNGYDKRVYMIISGKEETGIMLVDLESVVDIEKSKLLYLTDD